MVSGLEEAPAHPPQPPPPTFLSTKGTEPLQSVLSYLRLVPRGPLVSHLISDTVLLNLIKIHQFSR